MMDHIQRRRCVYLFAKDYCVLGADSATCVVYTLLLILEHSYTVTLMSPF